MAGQLARSRWACTVGLLTLVTALATPVPDASGEPTPEHPQERAKKIVDGLGGMSIGSIFPGPHGEQPQLEVLSQPPSPSPIPRPLGGLETETASITPVQAIGYSGYIVVVVVLFMYCKPRRKN
ncbi:uncharacterized protein LOC117649826 [Thrips palmi]|uniref:Uncharacterized protein LOC117649826 n=1 Tax=Thrips palmi TaxID=161013 RepID=A0A6P8ZUP9_THRPL|nr:uncharacterized protein LOC117649826 [Thrips palmi]